MKIQGVLDREHAIAKAHIAAGRKDRALIALRQRKYQQSLMTKTDQQLENLEQLVCIRPFSGRVKEGSRIYVRGLGVNYRVLPRRDVRATWP